MLPNGNVAPFCSVPFNSLSGELSVMLPARPGHPSLTRCAAQEPNFGAAL